MRRAPWRPSPRAPRNSRGAAWLLGAALLAHLVVGSLPVPVEPVSAGTSAVSLVDDRGGAALFGSTGLRPGRTETACVGLTVTGSAQSFDEVTLSAEVTEHGLAPYLFLTVERGTLRDPARCASFTGVPVWRGTLTQLPRTAAAGVPTGWRPADPTSMTYRVSVTVLDDRRAQGLRAAATFVWALDVEPFAPPPEPTPGPVPESTPGSTPAPAPVPAPGAEAAILTTAAPTPTPARSPSAVPTPPSQPAPSQPAPSAEPPVPSPPVLDPAGDPPRPSGGGAVVQAPPLQASPATVAEVVTAVGETALAVVEDGQFPVALIAVVVGFLAVQDRLDRSDPKLALAPVRQDLDDFQDFPSMPRTAPT